MTCQAQVVYHYWKMQYEKRSCSETVLSGGVTLCSCVRVIDVYLLVSSRVRYLQPQSNYNRARYPCVCACVWPCVCHMC